MNFARKRLTYANVMSSIAVFVVMGGAAFAATQLPKNSVGTKQLKKNAVTTAKIKKGAVTAAKVNVSGFPKVPSAANADNAAHANSADTATNATNAANANAVGGHAVNKIFAKIAKESTSTLGTFGPFKFTAKCSAAGDVEIEVDPQTTDTDYAAFGDGLSAGAFFTREQGAEPNSKVISEGNERGIVTFSGAQSGGTVVTGTLGWDDTSTFDSEPVCAVYGYLIS